jgi:branched-chain amino acid transport system substrate-binding protein
VLPALLLGACGSSSDGDSAGGSVTTVKLGAILGITGALAPYSQETLDGINAAAEYWNKQSATTGVKIDVDVVDDQSTPQGAAAAYQKAVAVNGDKIVMTNGTAPTLEVGKLAESGDVLNVDVGGNSPAVLSAGATTLHTNVNTADGIPAMYGFLSANGISDSLAVVYSDDAFGQSFNQEFSDYWKTASGHAVLGSVAYPAGESDYHAEVAQVLAMQPKAINLLGFGVDAVHFMQQLMTSGFKGLFLGQPSQVPEFGQLSHTITDGQYVIQVAGASGEMSDAGTYLHDWYQQKHPGSTDPTAALLSGAAFDGVTAIVQGVKAQAGQDKPWSGAALMQTIKGLPPMIGALSPTLKFASNGTVGSDFSLFTFQNGQEVLKKTYTSTDIASYPPLQ